MDDRLVRMAQPLVRLLGRLHPLRFEGLEHLPRGAALLVGNHGVFGYESPFFFEHILSHAGRLPIGLADRSFFRLPLVRDALVRLGGAYGCTSNALRAFERGDLVVCYPGGARETLKRESDKYRCLWRERLGYVRLAMMAGVPIIPFAAAGIDHTYRIIAHFRGAGRYLLGHGNYGLPVGWGVGPLPRPVPFWFRLGAPIPAPSSTGDASERELHAKVWSRTQAMLDALVTEWSAANEPGKPGGGRAS